MQSVHCDLVCSHRVNAILATHYFTTGTLHALTRGKAIEAGNLGWLTARDASVVRQSHVPYVRSSPTYESLEPFSNAAPRGSVLGLSTHSYRGLIHARRACCMLSRFARFQRSSLAFVDFAFYEGPGLDCMLCSLTGSLSLCRDTCSHFSDEQDLNLTVTRRNEHITDPRTIRLPGALTEIPKTIQLRESNRDLTRPTRPSRHQTSKSAKILTCQYPTTNSKSCFVGPRPVYARLRHSRVIMINDTHCSPRNLCRALRGCGLEHPSHDLHHSAPPHITAITAITVLGVQGVLYAMDLSSLSSLRPTIDHEWIRVQGSGKGDEDRLGG